MKAAIFACVILGLACQSYAFEDGSYSAMEESETGRLFVPNNTASTLSMLGFVILLGVIGYLLFASGLIGGSSYDRNGYYYDQYYQNQGYDGQAAYSEFRNAPGFASNVLNWIALLQNAYESAQ